MTSRTLSILANNGDIGGGEVMLLALATAARDAGYGVTVVAPQSPGGCADAAEERGFNVTRIPGGGRKAYMRGLRRWARHSPELLWCNGLVPATATALLRGSKRVVHLHRLPEGPQRLLTRVALIGAVETVVPSAFMASEIQDATVLPNWTDEISLVEDRAPSEVFRIGFLGRLAPEKGITVLLESLSVLRDRDSRVEALIAGESRFTSATEAEEIQGALARAGEHVVLGGWMDRDSVLSQIDVLAVPSVGPESFGLIAAEAMAAGVPVVVSDAGALPEVVGEGHPFVARRNDSGDLARVITKLLEDPSAAIAATQAARERWEREFSPVAGSARFVGLLKRLIDEATDSRVRGSRGV
ncbi:glycosyltransferase family 4 protein [Ornithinimicrobium cryptoxanthini]|uniref:Glycosyltransferase family 4 protein n=1 Tax=Ornithinimicrobium cryptoxanthini TaxID=2934161 RepID=A0ABY4YII6_9MICO|nr:glycosyltransferase family 4 protein [Ornithinimicrobium cryptoxanthini]USQ76600.1 glycosyltransferase family 4 protein [Ornithinimicrobium cryptoxanthini]